MRVGWLLVYAASMGAVFALLVAGETNTAIWIVAVANTLNLIVTITDVRRKQR